MRKIVMSTKELNESKLQDEDKGTITEHHYSMANLKKKFQMRKISIDLIN